MAKAKKLPSGNWRVRVWETKDGKQVCHSFTAPTKAEAEYKAAHYKIEPKLIHRETLREVVQQYIDLSEMLSPMTLHGYRCTLKYAFQTIMDTPVNELNDSVLQQAINIECKRKIINTDKQISPKSVRNEWILISASLKAICNLSFTVRLPRVQTKTNDELPDPQLIIDTIKGTDIEIPCLLAMTCSLRMSEIRGLMCSSIEGEYVRVDGVLLYVDRQNIRREYAKTDLSIRKMHLSKYLLNLIRKSDAYKEYKKTGVDRPLIDMSRDIIYRRFKTRMAKQGVDMKFHDLRHEFASISLNVLQLPESIVQSMGGWSDPAVMKGYYVQNFNKVQKESEKRIENYFDDLLK